MTYNELLPNRIIEQRPKQGKTNVSEIARKQGVGVVRLWHYFKGKRRWDCDVWLRTLAYLGLIRLTTDRRILIDVQLTEDQANDIARLGEEGKEWNS